MRRGGVVARQQSVQPALGLGNGGWNGKPEAQQPRRADRDEEGGNGFEPSSQVVDTYGDQVAAGQVGRFHRPMIPAARPAGQ